MLILGKSKYKIMLNNHINFFAALMSCDRPLNPDKVQALCNETMKLLLQFKNEDGKPWVQLTPTMESCIKNKTDVS